MREYNRQKLGKTFMVSPVRRITTTLPLSAFLGGNSEKSVVKALSENFVNAWAPSHVSFCFIAGLDLGNPEHKGTMVKTSFARWPGDDPNKVLRPNVGVTALIYQGIELLAANKDWLCAMINHELCTHGFWRGSHVAGAQMEENGMWLYPNYEYLPETKAALLASIYFNGQGSVDPYIIQPGG